MDQLSLFTVVLGLQPPWEVVDVACDPGKGRIDFRVAFGAGARFTCPYCGAAHQPVHDTRERSWRHLNFFQFQAHIHAKVPRVGSTQVEVPWARLNSGFSQLMEALLVTWCKAMTVHQVAQLLGVSDLRIWRTLDHYVEQARAQEDFSAVTSVGVDETAAGRGHDYISLVHDLDVGRLLFACEGRKAEVVAQFADDLEAHGACADNLRNVCIDLSASYSAGVREHLPLAAITFDSTSSKSSTRPWTRCPSSSTAATLELKDKHHWSRKQILQYAALSRLNLKTHRAYRIKERLREIFATAHTADEAEGLLEKWYSWARRSRLAPIKKVAKTLNDHWHGILNAFDSKLTNGRVEAVNSLIQAAKAKARSYGTTKHLITISYLVAGKLTRLPPSPFHTKYCGQPET